MKQAVKFSPNFLMNIDRTHLFYQSGDPESAVDLLQTIKVLQRSVELRHQRPLIHCAAVTCSRQQVLLGCRPGHKHGGGLQLGSKHNC